MPDGRLPQLGDERNQFRQAVALVATITTTATPDPPSSVENAGSDRQSAECQTPCPPSNQQLAILLAGPAHLSDRADKVAGIPRQRARDTFIKQDSHWHQQIGRLVKVATACSRVTAENDPGKRPASRPRSGNRTGCERAHESSENRGAAQNVGIAVTTCKIVCMIETPAAP